MRFFGFGKKQTREKASRPPSTLEHGEYVNASGGNAIVVYGTNDGARCRQVRALLEKRGYDYQDIRVDEDLSTRSWLQRTTGDDALPKVFVGTSCYGGFENVQVLVFDGTFDRILRGETAQTDKTDQLAALKESMSTTAICTLLRQGEILIIKEGDMVTEAWAEPLANPPLVYYEGTPQPIEALDDIVHRIITRLEVGEIEVTWKDDD